MRRAARAVQLHGVLNHSLAEYRAGARRLCSAGIRQGSSLSRLFASPAPRKCRALFLRSQKRRQGDCRNGTRNEGRTRAGAGRSAESRRRSKTAEGCCAGKSAIDSSRVERSAECQCERSGVRAARRANIVRRDWRQCEVTARIERWCFTELRTGRSRRCCTDRDRREVEPKHRATWIGWMVPRSILVRRRPPASLPSRMQSSTATRRARRPMPISRSMGLRSNRRSRTPTESRRRRQRRVIQRLPKAMPYRRHLQRSIFSRARDRWRQQPIGISNSSSGTRRRSIRRLGSAWRRRRPKRSEQCTGR